MPRFTLTVRSPTLTFEDTEGSELADSNAALAEARLTARELWADGIRIGQDRRHWAIEIADAAGQVQRTLHFEEAATRS